MKSVIVLPSGGPDCTTALALARPDGFNCQALSVNDEQCHQAELAAAGIDDPARYPLHA